MLSDSDSSDSDNGIRFKYHSVRAKEDGDAAFSSKKDAPRDDRRTNEQHHRNSDNRPRRSVSRERRRGRDRSKSNERPTERRRSRSRDRQLDRKPSNERSRDNSKFNNKLESNRSNNRNRSRSRDRHDRLNDSRGSNESRKRNNRSRSRDRRSDNRHEGSRSRNSSRNRDIRKRSRSIELDRSRGHRDRDDGATRNVRRPQSAEKVEIESKVRRNVSEIAPNSLPRADGKSRSSRKNSPVDAEDRGSIGERRKINAIDNRREIKADKTEDRRTVRNCEARSERHRKKSHPQSTNDDEDRPSVSSRSSSATADRSETSRNRDAEVSNHDDSFDPSFCGPALPPHMVPTTPQPTDDIGPVLSQRSPSIGSPPQRSQTPESKKPRVIGPVLPSGIDLEAAASSLPPDVVSDISDTEEDIDFDLVGPLPPGLSKSDAHLELERRALELKLAQLNDSDDDDGNEPVREEWMTALPAVRKVANMGLVARQFKAKAGPEIGDRTGWTDTPGDRERKAQRHGPTAEEVIAERQREAEAVFRAKRDAEQEKAATKHKKKHKRDQSLLDLHQKKLKKKQKVSIVARRMRCVIHSFFFVVIQLMLRFCRSFVLLIFEFVFFFHLYSQKEREKAKESGRPERRPFSREEDLKVNRFDDAQKKAVMKKAQLLDTRFGSGESKYL